MQCGPIAEANVFCREASEDDRIDLIIIMQALDETKTVCIVLEFILKSRGMFYVHTRAPAIAIKT